MKDPFLVDGPACIRFSGGRTSGMLLKRILDAHGGALPDDIIVSFSNTGKEKPQTLAFVNECATRWNVRIRWIEYRPVAPFFAEVSFLTADRKGRVFEQMVDKEGYMPNPAARLCTKNLKIKPNGRFMKALGLRDWVAVVGFRADEGGRVAANRDKTSLGYGCDSMAFPLAEAGLREEDVTAFWTAQPFDLQLRKGDGNCDHCFLLKTDQRIDRIRRDPDGPVWWRDLEERKGVPFRSTAPSYRQLMQYALDQQHMPFGVEDGLSDCMCGD